MKKAGLLISILVIGLFLAAGCPFEQREGEKASEELLPEKDITIRFTWWGSEDRAEKTIQAVRLFETKNPGIRVQTRYFPFETYSENLQIAAEMGYMPDVFQGYIGSDNQYVEDGLVECLDPYVEEGLIHADDISENLLNTGRLGGKLYGLSLGCNVRCLALDIEVYDRAGLEIPEVAYETWEALGEDLLRLKEITGVYGADDLFDKDFTFSYFMRQRGESIYSLESMNAINFSLESFREFFRIRNEWIDAGLIPPYSISSKNRGLGESQLVKGNAAVRYCYSNELSQLEQLSGREYALILMPGPNIDWGTEIKSGLHVCMSTQSKEKEAAAKLIDFLVNDVDANRILNAERGIPASETVRQALISEYGESEHKMAQIIELAQEHDKLKTEVFEGNTSVFSALWTDLEEEIMYGQISVEDAYEQLRRYSEQIE